MQFIEFKHSVNNASQSSEDPNGAFWNCYSVFNGELTNILKQHDFDAFVKLFVDLFTIFFQPDNMKYSTCDSKM